MKISCIIIDNDPEALKLLEEYIIRTLSLELKHVIIAKENIPIGGSYRVQLQKLQIF